ncbi:sensor histidine kinase [Euzebyella marina]|uniref:histidine kinase n=1 Tax=Euzebyella marina TaxID=1761453 RepID=A0A3G2L8X1_9FLAO|nr:sensor histidine kinase [Euzebyella marina]AYN68700.1 sensor histidine kinase [Euzebyella marina]
MWKKFLGNFLLLYIPLLVLSLLMLTSQKRERIVELSKQEALDAANKSFFISDVCHYLVHNSNYWTSILYPQKFNPQSTHKEFIRPYLEVLNSLGFYDQFRILDNNGNEVLRYQSYQGGILESAPLQSKIDREYVQKGLTLKKGNVFLSRINLNREYGEIERPYKPVLRSVGPIYDSLGNKLGLVVINFRMADILNTLTTPSTEGNTYIVDSNLDVISSNTSKFELPNEVKEFENLEEDKTRINVQGLLPFKDTTFLSDGAIWSLRKVDLENGKLRSSRIYNEPDNISTATDWAIVEEIPSTAIQAGMWQVYQNFIVLHLFSILAVAGISYGYLKYQKEKLFLVEELKQKNDSLLEGQKKLQKINKQVKQTNDRLKVRNEQLEQFNYLISHNLRAPVTSMSVIVDMLKNKKYEGHIKDLLPKLNTIADSIVNLTEDIRHYVTILDQNEIDIKGIDLIELIENVRKEFPDSINDDSGFRIIYQLEEWKVVNFSRFYLKSIIHNFISNAIKYRRKDVSSFLLFKSKVEDGRKVLYVEDNGIGVDTDRHKDDMFKLYKRFHRDVSGKGMGLFLVKTQLEALDASISLKSSVGKGTVFKIIF